MRSRAARLQIAFVVVAGAAGIAIIGATLFGLNVPPAVRIASLVTTFVAGAMVWVEAIKRLRR